MAGLLFKARTQMAVAAGLRSRGFGIFEARRLSQTVDNETIQMAVAMAPAGVSAKVGAIGDGTIIQAIIDFFNSPLGKQLIDLIISLIMGL